MSKRNVIGLVFTGLLLVIVVGAIFNGCSSRGDLLGRGNVKLTVGPCDDIVSGRVENTSDHILDSVWISVDFVDRKGKVIDTSTAYVTWLKPGATAPWSVAYNGYRDYDDCHAEVALASEMSPPTIEDIEIP